MSAAEALVGILGGMGPAATADFYAILVRLAPAVRDQDHPRVVIWADPTVPPRVPAVLAGTDEPYPRMLAGALALARLGVTVAAMPCHTAHVFLPRLITDSGVPFVDMVAETVRVLSASPATVGIMATRGTLRSELYQRQLAAAGVTYVEPEAETQRLIDEAISCVKAGDASSGAGCAVDAVRRMGEAGAQRIVLACTELPIALRGADAAGLPTVLDPSHLLAAAVLAEYSRQAKSR